MEQWWETSAVATSDGFNHSVDTNLSIIIVSVQLQLEYVCMYINTTCGIY